MLIPYPMSLEARRSEVVEMMITMLVQYQERAIQGMEGRTCVRG